MNSAAAKVVIDRERVNHVPQKTPVTSARRNKAAKVATIHVVARCTELPIELARKSSSFPTTSRRRLKRTVPCAQISERYLTRRSAPGSRGLYIVPDRKLAAIAMELAYNRWQTERSLVQ